MRRGAHRRVPDESFRWIDSRVDASLSCSPTATPLCAGRCLSMAAAPTDGDGKFKPGFPGDRATAPTPLEDGSDDIWQEFVRLRSIPASLAPTGALSPQATAGAG